MLRKLPLLLFLLALSVWAADFWTAKPFTAWSDKEVQKMLEDSPWSAQVMVGGSVSMSSPTVGSGGGRGGRGGGGGGDAGGGGDSAGAGAGGDAGAGGSGGGGGSRGATITLVWQSALPVKQALARRQYGAEAGTSPDAKARLERAEEFYMLTMIGIPASMRGATANDKKAALLALTTVTAPGKPAIHATDMQVSSGRGPSILVFLFPKTSAFTVDDKEVEFATKFDKTSVKRKFKLKAMVFNGKLEM
jgi:hypothetical protein